MKLEHLLNYCKELLFILVKSYLEESYIMVDFEVILVPNFIKEKFYYSKFDAIYRSVSKINL